MPSAATTAAAVLGAAGGLILYDQVSSLPGFVAAVAVALSLNALLVWIFDRRLRLGPVKLLMSVLPTLRNPRFLRQRR